MKSISAIEFRREVLESQIPVVVNFWAPWCGVCRLIEPLLLQLQASADFAVKVVQINADENFHLARQYQLKSVPTLLVFEAGELRQRLDPQTKPGDLRDAVNQLLEPLMRQPCLQQE